MHRGSMGTDVCVQTLLGTGVHAQGNSVVRHHGVHNQYVQPGTHQAPRAGCTQPYPVSLFLFFFFFSILLLQNPLPFFLVQVKPDMDSKPATNHGVKPLGWHLGAPGTGLGTAPRARAAWCVCALLISPLAQLFSQSELCSAPPARQQAAVALPEGGTAWDLPGCRHPIPQGHTLRQLHAPRAHSARAAFK